jgi:anthranilate synthase component II
MPECLRVTARTGDGVVMAVAHRRRPVIGVQFHPESILTEHGYPLLANFLRLAGLTAAAPVPSFSSERSEPETTSNGLPKTPVTF